jgi:CheY-like chemotaxis protein
MAELSWVLLVEDEPDHRVLVKEVLRRLAPDVLVTEVGTAPEALRWLEASASTTGALASGFVILDLGLPGPSGFDLLEWMREVEHFRRVPVIVLTASENPLDADHAFNLGAKGYFQKPTDFRRYVDLFERVLNIVARNESMGERVEERPS